MPPLRWTYAATRACAMIVLPDGRRWIQVCELAADVSLCVLSKGMKTMPESDLVGELAFFPA